MTRAIASLALAASLLPGPADAVMLRRSLPSHVPAPSAAVGRIRSGDPPRSRSSYHRRRERARRGPPRRSHVARAPTEVGDRQTVAPQLIHVHDGDTFYVGAETIRLRGIDTPELGQPRAYEATRRLIELLHAGPVTIVRRAEDVYGRIVADVSVGGRDVASVLRAEGYAKPRPPPLSHAWLASGSLDIPLARASCDFMQKHLGGERRSLTAPRPREL